MNVSKGILENFPGPHIADLSLNSGHPHFDPQLLAPSSGFDPTSGNFNLVSVIGLTGISFSALPKRFWSKLWLFPWQAASDSIAHPNPSLSWLGRFSSQTGPGTVVEHCASPQKSWLLHSIHFSCSSLCSTQVNKRASCGSGKYSKNSV